MFSRHSIDMMTTMSRAQEALEEERTARVEAEALAARLRSQLSGLREAQTSQQASAQQRLAALQAHLASLASRVVSLLELFTFYVNLFGQVLQLVRTSIWSGCHVSQAQ